MRASSSLSEDAFVALAMSGDEEGCAVARDYAEERGAALPVNAKRETFSPWAWAGAGAWAWAGAWAGANV